MKRVLSLAGAGLAALALTTSVPQARQTAAAVETGFTSVFNGRDLTGWTVTGAQDTFKVQDGAIVANGRPAHAFYTGEFRNHSFRNFQLRVDVMTRRGSNGGVYVLTEPVPTETFPKKGFEIQVNN